jgi:hypothetical protein
MWQSPEEYNEERVGKIDGNQWPCDKQNYGHGNKDATNEQH